MKKIAFGIIIFLTITATLIACKPQTNTDDAPTDKMSIGPGDDISVIIPSNENDNNHKFYLDFLTNITKLTNTSPTLSPDTSEKSVSAGS